MTRTTLKVTGMTCGGCENAIKRVLSQMDGVEAVSASHRDGTVEVSYDAGKVTPETFKQKIEAIGYQVAA